MKRLLIILLLPFLLSPTQTAGAADGAQIFQGILGVLGSIEQAEQEKRLRDFQALQPAINACIQQGNIAMCDVVLQSPALPPQNRPVIEWTRAELVKKQQIQRRLFTQYQSNWRSCHAGNLAACNAALQYTHINARDRGVLLRKRHEIIQAQRQKQNPGVSVGVGGWQPVNKGNFVQVPAQNRYNSTGTIRNTQASPSQRVSHTQSLHKNRNRIPQWQLAAAILTLSLLTIFGAFAYHLRYTRNSSYTLPPEEHPMQPVTELPFTGHMPTDVRTALYG